MKIIGVGLNKTGTTTLGKYLKRLGYRHQTYDLEAFRLYQKNEVDQLCKYLEDYDSCEDWPWPLMYRELAEYFPDARFILTTRKSADAWYRSLCKMAVRMGPLRQFEKHIYGYSMPHGHKEEHVTIYRDHNAAVKDYFADQPDRLLCLSFEQADAHEKLLRFLGQDPVGWVPIHANKSDPVYAGDNLWRAHFNRMVYQTKWYTQYGIRQTYYLLKRVAKLILGKS